MGPLGPSRALLDTHVLLWMLTDPGQLSDRMRAALGDRRAQIFVSAASAWEIATKHRLGKLPQAEVLVHGYRKHLDRLGAATLDIAPAHCLLAGSMQWPHRDPFDRMLAAQCMLESLPLVTSDRVFAGLTGVSILW